MRISLDEARKRLDELRPRIDALIARRAVLAELRADLAAGEESPNGNLADAKAMEAALFGELECLAGAGATIKGFAPLLLDFPGERDGLDVLWCWLEGDAEITWYHRADCGFAGRRPI